MTRDELLKVVEEYELDDYDAFAAYVENKNIEVDSINKFDVISVFNDLYVGCYLGGMEEFVEHEVEEAIGNSWVCNYVDYKKMAKDFECDYELIDGVYVFKKANV